jgi:histone acetyltransferase
VPDYLEVVHDPIDLSLIKKRLDHGQHYDSAQALFRDIARMCDNCKIFNHPDTQYYVAADSLLAFTTKLFSTAGLMS